MQRAQRLNHTGSFGWKPNGELVWSEETYRIDEWDHAEKLTLIGVFERIHPQVAQQVVDDLSRTVTEFETRIVS